MTNTTLYELTTEMKWSDRIKQNRIRFTGHLLRLPEETPVQQSLKIALTQSQLPRGISQTTWIKLINNDLQSLNLDQIGSQKLRETASDKKTWKKLLLSLWSTASSSSCVVRIHHHHHHMSKCGFL